MTGNVPARIYAQALGDPDTIARLVAEWEALGPKCAPAKRARKPKPAAEPAPKGPWILSIEGMGRPPTTNAERSSSMSRGAMARTREAKRTWDAAITQAATDAGIPPLPRVLTVIQPYYRTNKVPDPDGIAPAHKAVHDGLVAAGVLADDGRSQLVMGYQVLPPITDGNPERMTVTIFPLPA